MLKKAFPFFIYISALGLMFFLSNVVFKKIEMFEHNPWVDIPLHFICGFLTAGLWAYSMSLLRRKVSFFEIFSVVFIVGAVWEAIEAVGIIGPGWHGWNEAIKDLCVDLLGMYLFWITFRIKGV